MKNAIASQRGFEWASVTIVFTGLLRIAALGIKAEIALTLLQRNRSENKNAKSLFVMSIA
jgi:hypothetical protein